MDHTCKTDHSKLADTLAALPESQKQPVRHVCAGCAYAAGYQKGRSDERAPKK